MNKSLKVFLIILIFLTIVFLKTKNNSLIYEIPLSQFEPFSDENVLKNYSINFKIKDNLPRVEAASAFGPFTANLIQNIYDEEAYTKDLFDIVSTNQAYYNLINGKVDIIFTTKPSEEQENSELVFEPIFLEPLVIFTNKNNSIKNLDIAQIQEIYYSENENWNTYQLEKNNGSQTCFETIIKDNTISNNHYEVKTMSEIIDKVGQDKNGIGYAFNSYYSTMHFNNNTKTICVNNKLISENDYPLLFPVYLVYRKDNKNENIDLILKWLQTEEGKEFIENIKV